MRRYKILMLFFPFTNSTKPVKPVPAKSADSKNTPRHKMHNAYTSIIIMQTSQSPVSPRTTGSNNNNKKRKTSSVCNRPHGLQHDTKEQTPGHLFDLKTVKDPSQCLARRLLTHDTRKRRWNSALDEQPPGLDP